MISLPPSVTPGLIYVVCAIVLFAQQAALTHVASHLSGTHAAHEQRAVHHEGDHSPASDAARACALDVLFGQVLSGGPAHYHAVFFDRAASHTARHRSRAYTPAEALNPRSRGPPALL